MNLTRELLEKIKKIILICKEPADNIQVLEMQESILRVIAERDTQSQRGNNEDC